MFTRGLFLCAGLVPIAQNPPTGGLRLPQAVESDILAPSDRLAGRDNAREESDLGLAFVEVLSPRESAVVGEVVTFEIRFGLDAQFLEHEAVPLFRRHLDVPVQIEAPWIDAGDSAELTRLFVAVEPAQRVLVARNDLVGEARRLPDRNVNGREFRVFALDVARIETSVGTLRLGAPRLSYAAGLDFRDDFLTGGRTPRERRDAFVLGSEVLLRIEPVPENDRPTTWSGAVGNFEIAARVLATDERTRSSVRFELVIAGHGDLGTVDVPGARDFPGFALLGVLDDSGRARRTIVYDLEPTGAGTREVAPVSWSFFDPRPPARWRTLTTAPVTLPGNLAASTPDRPSKVGGDVDTSSPSPLLTRVLVGAGVLIAAVFVLLSTRELWLRTRARPRKEQRAAPRQEPPPWG